MRSLMKQNAFVGRKHALWPLYKEKDNDIDPKGFSKVAGAGAGVGEVAGAGVGEVEVAGEGAVAGAGAGTGEVAVRSRERSRARSLVKRSVRALSTCSCRSLDGPPCDQTKEPSSSQ